MDGPIRDYSADWQNMGEGLDIHGNLEIVLMIKE
jgi:hypothetical protein